MSTSNVIERFFMLYKPNLHKTLNIIKNVNACCLTELSISGLGGLVVTVRLMFALLTTKQTFLY